MSSNPYYVANQLSQDRIPNIASMFGGISTREKRVLNTILKDLVEEFLAETNMRLVIAALENSLYSGTYKYNPQPVPSSFFHSQSGISALGREQINFLQQKLTAMGFERVNVFYNQGLQIDYSLRYQNYRVQNYHYVSSEDLDSLPSLFLKIHMDQRIKDVKEKIEDQSIEDLRTIGGILQNIVESTKRSRLLAQSQGQNVAINAPYLIDWQKILQSCNELRSVSLQERMRSSQLGPEQLNILQSYIQGCLWKRIKATLEAKGFQLIFVNQTQFHLYEPGCPIATAGQYLGAQTPQVGFRGIGPFPAHPGVHSRGPFVASRNGVPLAGGSSVASVTSYSGSVAPPQSEVSVDLSRRPLLHGPAMQQLNGRREVQHTFGPNRVVPHR